MKKLFGLFFVLALAFVLFACGKEYKIEISADQANVTVEKGESVTITPTFTEGETLTWTTSDAKVVTVEGGKLTAVEEGTATITVAITGKEDKASAEVKVTVKPISVKEVTLTGKTACFIGDEFDLTLTVSPDGAKDKSVTWASSDAKIATVTNGKVKALAAGEVTISATANDGSGKKAELKITVSKINVSGVSVTGNASMNVGDTQDLVVRVDPNNATEAGVKFESTNTEVLTVTAAGKVTAVGPGTAKVVVTAKDDASKKAELEITVISLVQDITIDGDNAMNVNDTQKLDIAIDPEDASNKEYTLSSSDEAVLTVDAEGNVTAVGAGTAKVIATAKDGSGVTGELEITVTLVKLTGLELTGSKDMVVNGEQTLKVDYVPATASYKGVRYASSDPEVMTVDENGKVTALKAGKAVITVTSTNDESKSSTLEITAYEATTAITAKGDANMFVGKEQTLVVTVAPEGAMNKFDFTSSDATVVTVYESGLVKALKPGTAKITIAAKDGSGITAEVEIAVFHEVVYVKLGATEDITRGEETLKLNDNLFATVDAALAVVGAGGKVVLLPGTYADKIEINKAVTLTSDLAEKNPVEDDADFKDATKAAIITGKVYPFESNITIEGLTFTGAARVLRYSGSVDKANFTFQNNLVYDIDATTAEWKAGRYGTGVSTDEKVLALPGFICLAGYYAWAKNTTILNNKFSNVQNTAVFIACTNTVTLKGNVFNNIKGDGIRFDYASNCGTYLIEDNVFDTLDYNGVYLQSYGASSGATYVTVKSNLFKDCCQVNKDATGAILGVGAFATAAHQEATDATFLFQYNIFQGNKDNISIRGNVTKSATYSHVFTLDVSYNAFVLKAADAMINRNFFSTDTAETNFAIGTFDNNFYGSDLLTKQVVADANYENIVKKDATVYNNIYALEKAIPDAAHLPAYTATPALKTVAEAYELELNTPVALKGQVSYVYSGGFWLKDETGAIYVYGHNDEVKLGDKVEVEGNLYNYKDTKRLNFAKTVKVTEAGTYTAEYTAKTEDEFKVMTEAGKEIALTGVQVLRISNAYVYCKLGSTEFTINTNSNADAIKYAAFVSSEKTISVNALTYFKDGSKAMSVMATAEDFAAEEGFAPLYYVVDQNATKKNAVVNKFSELTLADGMTIKVADGTYDEEITIDKKNVTIEGIGDEVVLTAKMNIADGVEGLTVKGLTFTNGAVVIAAAPAEGAEVAGLKDITFDGNTVVFATSADDAWLHFYVPVENFKFTNNDCQFKTNRGIRWEAASHNALVDNNKFVNHALHYDTVRAMDLLDGDVTISNNWFENTTQSFVQIRYVGNGNYNVVGNTFKNAACVSVDLREAKTADFEGKAVINVLRNTFDGGANDWGTIRLRNSWASGVIENASEKVEANINFNKFVNIEFDSDTTYYVDKPTKNCTAESWNIDKNYSDKGQPVLGADGWFCGMEKSAANWFESLDEFEYAAFPPVYDFETYFGTYGSSWNTTYGVREMTPELIGMNTCMQDLSFVLSRACKQSSTINTMPVLAANASAAANKTVYITVSGDLSGIKYAKFTTKAWSNTATKRYADIHLEYTTDGENWIACSEVVKEAGELETNVALENAKAIRLSFTTAYSGNVQLGVKAIELAKEAPAPEVKKANLTLDFMDGTVGSQYANANWTQEKYTTDWEAVTGQMNCREKDGVRVVNFTSGYGMTHRYTYKTEESLGLANKLTFKAGNYFSPNQPIPVKVILIDTAGVSHYLVGTADAFYDFPTTTGLVDQELTFDAIEVAAIRIVAKYGGQSSAYLYVGNMQLTFAE